MQFIMFKIKIKFTGTRWPTVNLISVYKGSWCYFSDFCVNLLIHAFLKLYLGKGNLDGKRQITANIIYLVRELYLGDRIGSFLLLDRWVVATLFDFHWMPFSHRSLATSRRCAANNCLYAEAEGAILHATWKVWRMHSEINISCGRGQGILVASPLQEVHITKCGGSEWVRSQKQL